MITSLATQFVTISRPTAFVRESTAIAGTVAPSAQPPRSSVIEVEVFRESGSGDSAGEVEIVGSLAGVSQNETLSMSLDGFGQTVNRFDTITEFRFTGSWLSYSPTPKTRIRSIGPGGENQSTYSTVVSGWPAHVESVRRNWSGGAEGMDIRSEPVALIDYAETWSPQIGDVLATEDGTEYLIRGVRLERAPSRPIHWTLNLSERGDSV